MKIEEKVFEQKKFIPEKLLKYGFCEVGNGYEYKTDFMNGEFQASIFVTKEGKASGKVIDVMNDEKYSRLHAENCSDSYVISVQNAYIELLTSIAESCCKILLFASAQANRIMEKISQKKKSEPFWQVHLTIDSVQQCLLKRILGSFDFLTRRLKRFSDISENTTLLEKFSFEILRTEPKDSENSSLKLDLRE